MGNVRKHAPHIRWTEDEISILRSYYANAPLSWLETKLNRPRKIFQCKANALGLTRVTKPKRTREEYLAAKRESMAKQRAKDPQALRDRRKAYHAQNRDARCKKMRDYAARRFFWNREMHLRGKDRATARQLASLWKYQKGKCALTGKRLDRTAQLDHCLPKAKGGEDRIENLQWVCAEINRAKRDLTHDQFISLCKSVISWNDRRIQLVDLFS